MRLVGSDLKTLGSYDARVYNDVVGKRIYEFDVQKEDYILKPHLIWDEVIGEYKISVGGYKYIVPSGVYLFCGDDNGSTDWILVDEIINRDIMVFQMNMDFGEHRVEPIEFDGMCNVSLFMPKTNTPKPIADLSGKRTIVISNHDMYHKLKDLPYDALFIS